MSRYMRDLPTPLGPDEVMRTTEYYLRSEGFSLSDRRGETAWQKGSGWVAVPQFVKVIPGHGVVRVEAWLASVALLPGIYAGEMGLTGFWGWAIKSALRSRVQELERRLAGGGAPTAVAPAGWLPDPTGKYQQRYWDGTRWTDQVATDGRPAIDPV